MTPLQTQHLEHILCYLEPIRTLLEDETISEVMINHDKSVFLERAGVLSPFPVEWPDEEYLYHAARAIPRILGQDISPEFPYVDTRLADGSRVAIAIPPVSPNGITITIRKFQRQYFTLETLVEIGTVPESVADRLREIIATRRNLLISGGTGTGKTSMLNALVRLIDPSERLGILEDTQEIQVNAPNTFQFEARAQEPRISIRDLVKVSLRHRPDRLIVGEVRGPEAFDLMNALNTGHGGSLTTIHADSAGLALSRLTTCILMALTDWEYKAIRRSLSEAIHYVLHLRRHRTGQRVVSELVRITGYDMASDTYTLTPLDAHHQQ